MYIILAGCAQQGAGTPLSAQIDATHSNVDVVDVIGSGIVTGKHQLPSNY